MSEPPTSTHAPVAESGLARLAGAIAAEIGPRSFGVDGPQGEIVGAAFGARGPIEGDAAARSGGSVEVVVAIGASDGVDAEEARRLARRWTDVATFGVVFAAGGRLVRSPLWWDALFAEVGFLPCDVLRSVLWDDPAWEAAALTTLTLYVRRERAEEVQSAAVMPRSAVHPGVDTADRHVVEAVTSLATGIVGDSVPRSGAVAVVRASLDERAARVAAARVELEDVATHLRREHDMAIAVSEAALADSEAALADSRREVEEARIECAASVTLAEETESARRRAVDDADGLRRELASGSDTHASDGWSGGDAGPSFGERATRAVLRRVEGRTLRAADRLGALPGRAGRLSARAAAVYREMRPIDLEALRVLFDVGHYLSQVPTLRGAHVDPVGHYLRHGWHWGLDPHPLFDTKWYVRRYGFGVHRGVSPLEHFLAMGWLGSYDPHPLFDTRWYLEQSPDVVATGANPLLYFLGNGWREGKDPHPLFDTRWYLQTYPDVAAAGCNPLVHFVVHGARDRRSPSEIFDSNWYLSQYPDAAISPLPPYRFYLDVGLRRGDHPSAWAQAVSAAGEDCADRIDAAP